MATGYSMAGWRRISNVYDLCTEAVREGIRGAFVECGVYNGGCAAVMAGVSDHLDADRTTWLFDSFEGLPQPTDADGDDAKEYAGLTEAGGHLLAIDRCVGSLQKVEEVLFKRVGVAPESVRIVKGWFQDTLPATSQEIGPISVLRLDGDWYESTLVCLNQLFAQVSPGGFVVLDDYGYWPGCRRATTEFLEKMGLDVELHWIDDSGVYFRKPSGSQTQPG